MVGGTLCNRGGMSLEETEYFWYLGKYLKIVRSGLERAVRTMVAVAWTKWSDTAALLIKKNVPLVNSSSICNACIRPVFLYGADMGTDLENEGDFKVM